MPRKRTKKNYFTEETEKKIFEYIETTSQSKRNLIYFKHLEKPIRMIAEVYYSKIDTDYIEESREDAINDCISYLMTKSIFGIKKGKGKAYSYLSISARNHYILANNRNYAKRKKFVTESYPEDVSTTYKDTSYEVKEYNDEFLKIYYNFIKWMRRNMPIFEYPEKTEKVLLDICEYLETFQTDRIFKKEVLLEFRGKYNYLTEVEKSREQRARTKFFKHWTRYKLHYEKYGTEPIAVSDKYTKVDVNIPQEKIDYIQKRYIRNHHSFGMRAMCRKLVLKPQVVQYYLNQANLD